MRRQGGQGLHAGGYDCDSCLPAPAMMGIRVQKARPVSL